MTRIVRATGEHIRPLAKLMAASPLLRRYRVTEGSARVGLAEALRMRDILLVAVNGREPIGLAWVIATRALDGTAYLRLLLVGEAEQSHGLGSRLLARAERDGRAAGSRHFILLVTRTNRRARSFYERHGYTHLGDVPGFVRPGIAESLYLKSWRA